MKEKLLASAALVLLACTPAMAQGLDDVKHKFASVSGIVQDKCMACHSRGYDLPFYAKVPGISGIIEKDYRDGIRAMDLNQELVQRKDRPVGETVLAKWNGSSSMTPCRPPNLLWCTGAAACPIRTRKTS